MRCAKIAPLAPVTPRTMVFFPEDGEGMRRLWGNVLAEVKEATNPCYTAHWRMEGRGLPSLGRAKAAPTGKSRTEY